MVGFTDRNACSDDTVVLVLRRGTFKRSDKVAPPNVGDNDYDDSVAGSGPSFCGGSRIMAAARAVRAPSAGRGSAPPPLSRTIKSHNHSRSAIIEAHPAVSGMISEMSQRRATERDVRLLWEKRESGNGIRGETRME
ncbi:hypothetical protein Y032_0035g3054 [Ancylostoma ceylanicum]|uniref:Uncharacterized protein n=1 Tax=Ancylostoma ceylanicum TaxID=53326 RepID=A0A016UN69_9BILA|nr:hypothetical protein Y032_0035g3054 [Ancylostoma ceylanicum]